MRGRKVICYLSASAGDYGGASRVLFTNLKLLDREAFEPIVLLPKAGPITEELERRHIRYELWGKHEPDGVAGYLCSVGKALRFFKRNRVDLLHINHCNYWRPAEIVAAWTLRIPIVTHYHMVIKDPGPFVRFSSLLVAVSAYAAEHSLPGDIPRRVVPNAIELARFDGARSIRPELGIAEGAVVLTFIGQIRDIKGIDLFLELARELAGPGLWFLIAGECRDPVRFRGFYSQAMLEGELGGSKHIRYLGYRGDIENVYRASDIIVMPSRCAEAFGLVNIEAGAARRPVIAAALGGIPEVVRHGETGYLFPPDDYPALLASAKALVSDRPLRERLGEQARTLVESRFTSAPVRLLERTYEELIDRRGAARILGRAVKRA